MTVRERLIMTIVSAQQEAADLYLAVQEKRTSIDTPMLLRLQDLMARRHACVEEGLDWLLDDEFMREWQQRCDKIR
jgi:hypothetical protein